MSLAESLDAFRAVEKLGIVDRDRFRVSLRSTLIKGQEGLSAFDRLFPLFFGTSPAPPNSMLRQELTAAEEELLQHLLDQLGKSTRQQLEDLLEGQPLELDEDTLRAQLSFLDDAGSMRYLEWLARRLEKSMGFESLRDAIEELLELLAQLQSATRNKQIADQLTANLGAWQEQIRHMLGATMAQSAPRGPATTNVSDLADLSFSSLNEQEMRIIRQEVRRLAAILKSRMALRMKRAKDGRLDPRATLRANLKHLGIPVTVIHKNRDRKARVVAICDLSTSMRFCSELMLTLLFHINDLISKTHAFAFIDHLEYISPDFTAKPADAAVSAVLRRMPPGYYSTDLGRSLHDFDGRYLNTIDRNTSLIIVGDGRNNYNNPRTDIFKVMARRARRVIWINPEPQPQWSSGDSDMWSYHPYCDDILRIANLRQLTAAMDTLVF